MCGTSRLSLTLTPARALALLSLTPSLQRGVSSNNHAHSRFSGFVDRIIDRLGLSADWWHVFAEAAKLDKALEVDCYPDRQDLNVSLLKLARAEGTRISLGTDAHHRWQLEFIHLGLAAPMRTEIPPARIVNFMTVEAPRNWVAGLRERCCKR